MSEIYGFEPIFGCDCRVLILGSMPSVKSLADAQYYAHPRNAFWPIMCELLGQEYTADYARRKSLLTQNGIALWDVCHCCERETSSDSKIHNEVPNEIGALIAKLGIHTVLLNGGTAAALFKKYVHADVISIKLPSTSPAYTIPYERKKLLWREALISADILPR